MFGYRVASLGTPWCDAQVRGASKSSAAGFLEECFCLTGGVLGSQLKMRKGIFSLSSVLFNKEGEAAQGCSDGARVRGWRVVCSGLYQNPDCGPTDAAPSGCSWGTQRPAMLPTPMSSDGD